jgi:hypothetical protein
MNTVGRPYWALKPNGTSLARQMKRYVYEFWREKARPRVKEVGTFPDFEMPIAYSFLKKSRNTRYIQAFERCSKYQTTKGISKVMAIVTHRAGVETMYEYLLGKSSPDIPTAGYFIVQRTVPDNKGKSRYELLYTGLDSSNK